MCECKTDKRTGVSYICSQHCDACHKMEWTDCSDHALYSAFRSDSFEKRVEEAEAKMDYLTSPQYLEEKRKSQMKNAMGRVQLQLMELFPTAAPDAVSMAVGELAESGGVEMCVSPSMLAGNWHGTTSPLALCCPCEECLDARFAFRSIEASR